ncbi:MAG TPA: hypothetical protein DD376_02480 [Sutterella sp.]|nr:hypothetical protein [Sutterella sp.]
MRAPDKWFRSDGSVVACTEKVKVLEENWKEIQATLQDALDDAVLMGCSAEHVKAEWCRLVSNLSSRYKDQSEAEK